MPARANAMTAAWRTETLLAASAFVDRMGKTLLCWFLSWLTAQERIGPGGWAIAQQFAFGARVEPLLVHWYEEHPPR